MESVKVEVRPGYLYFYMAEKPLNIEEALAVQAKVLAELKASKLSRMLFEKGGEQRLLRIEDFYTLSETFGKQISGLKIALVVAKALHTPEVAFFELATGSSGNNLRYFESLSKAEAWLLEP